jgi:hypothetical protein
MAAPLIQDSSESVATALDVDPKEIAGFNGDIEGQTGSGSASRLDRIQADHPR